VKVWRQGTRTPEWWLAAALGFALIAIDLAGQAHRGVADARVLYFLATLTVAVLVGLWAWAWRSPPRMGKLMYLWPVLVVTADLPNAYPDSSVASTIGLATYVFGLIVFAQMALSYPTGYLMPGRLAFFYIFIGGYLAEVVQNVVNMLFWDNRACRPFCATPYAPTLIHVGSAPFSLETWNKGWTIFVMAILPIGLYLLGRRYYQASVGVRRSIGPVLATGIFITVMGWIYDYAFLTDRFSALTPLSWWLTSGLLVGALTALFGLLVGRRVRGSVGDLVVELDRAGPGGVRRALARAVGDPTLELALWLPEAGTWADESGRPVVLPEGRDRAVTLIGDRLAAIVHDPVLLDQTAMLEAVGTAARVALENERLQAELRAQLVALRESRARIVRAGDEERRRLERNLHDGAQQRLLGVGMGLQMLKARMGGDADASVLLDDTQAEVQMALQELRELARGIHPAVLTDQGLAAAVRTLAERAPLPVEVSDGGEALPPHVETAAYFVVAEAIANIVKYAQASRAWVTIDCRDGEAVVEVRDDGIGGAKEDGAGSGLRGLADRVGALDGRLIVESPPGSGTRLRAEIPCGS
jgi:signal transduction histidine kinase